MYESFYGLKELPFKITPDDRIFFGGGQRQDMVEALLYAIGRGEGLITVVGEVGIGKTTLARVLVSRLPSSVKLISLFTPNLSPDDMLHSICQELSFEMPIGSSRATYLDALKRYLLNEQAEGRRVVLLIDEAQTVPLETLESLRLLSNLETNDFKLLQMLLFGQPELETILARPEARQIQDRVVYQIQLLPFSPQELEGYLDFRMRSAGYQGPMLFSESVIEAIYVATKGYARSVNKLVDHVLMSAYAKGQKEFTADDVRAVVNVQQRIQVREHAHKGFNFAKWWQKTSEQIIGEPVVRLVFAGVTASVILVVVGYYLSVLLFSPVKPTVVAEAIAPTPVTSTAKVSSVMTVKPEIVEETPKTQAVDRLELDAPKVLPSTPSTVATKSGPVVAAPVVAKVAPVEVALSQQRIVSESAKTEKTVLASEAMPEKAVSEPPVKVAKVASMETREVTKPSAPVRPVIESRWPLAANWVKHHSITLGQLQELNRVGVNQYTIQLMSDPWRLREPFTARAEQMLDQLAPEQVFVSDYVLADGRPRIALLYGVYATKEEAMQAVSRMPMNVQKNTPVILSLNRMIEQMRSSDAYSRSE